MKRIFWIQPLISTAILLLIACKKEESSGFPPPYPVPHWPVVKTLGITNAIDTLATLNGTVNAYGLSTIVIFEYGTTTNYGSTVTASQSPVTGNSITKVSADISGLKPDSTYHFRVKAENSLWENFYGSDIEYTVQTLKISELNVSRITSTSATMNGTVNAGGLPTAVSFEYGTTASYGNTIPAYQNPIAGNSFTNVRADISGLIPCETYHFRVKAVNSFRTVYGDDIQSTIGEPTASTLAATNNSATVATLHGIANANGLPTTVTFEYGTTASYGQEVSALQSTVKGNENTNVSVTLSGLTDCCSYHFRVKAVNSCGTEYGNDMILIASTPLTLTTTSVTGITATTAISGGSIPYDGCSVITDRGVMFWYSISGKIPPKIGLTHDGTGAGNFTSNLTGLRPNTYYRVKSYAKTLNGTTYGPEMSFKTPPL